MSKFFKVCYANILIYEQQGNGLNDVTEIPCAQAPMQAASAAIKAKRNCLYITSLSIFHYIATNSKNPLLKHADSRVAYVYMRAYIRAHAIKKPKQWNYVVII